MNAIIDTNPKAWQLLLEELTLSSPRAMYLCNTKKYSKIYVSTKKKYYFVLFKNINFLYYVNLQVRLNNFF